MVSRINSTVIPGADPGFGQGGAPGSEAESCRRSEVESREQSEQFAAGVQGLLKGPGSFWVFNAQICLTSLTCAKLNDKMAFPA